MQETTLTATEIEHLKAVMMHDKPLFDKIIHLNELAK